jgi:ABC-type uncharacterized transport system involved in gliding motility auxiliary subunit
MAAALLMVGILVVAAMLANRYHLRWDLTRDQSQSLSAVTKNLLGEVTRPLALTVFSPEGGQDRMQAKEALQRFTYVNPQITYRFVDPERQPEVARAAGYRFAGNALLEYDGRRQMADRLDEENLANSLRKILKPGGKKVYFLEGQGERDINDAKSGGLQVARKALENEGLAVQGLNLLTQRDIPQDAAVVIVASPKKPLLPQELAALKDYLGRGGKLLVMLEPFQDGGLKDFLAGYGVGLDDGIVLDYNNVSQALGASAVMPLVAQYGPHRITRDFQNLVTIFPMARPLVLKQQVAQTSLLPLCTSMATSWEKLGKEWQKSGEGDYDSKADQRGPFTLAALGEINLESKKPDVAKEKKAAPPEKPAEAAKAYLAVFGSVDFAANTYFNLLGNGDLFLNTVNFLAGEEKQIIIRKDDQKGQLFTLQGYQAWIMFLISLALLPLALAVGGIWAYRRRRALR